MKRPIRPARRRKLALASLTVALLCLGGVLAGVGSAAAAGEGATPAIEAVWSFNGGQIGIKQLSDGSYDGTVVEETKFAECTHPVGQSIWTGMKEQKDGSFSGWHQWYSANCEINPQLGPTAWRILQEPGGGHYLRVCFSKPGSKQQPEIAANGDPKEESEYSKYNVTYGCYNSALIAPLPVAPGAEGSGTGTPGSSGTPGSGGTSDGGGKGATTGAVESLTLPPAGKCVSPKLKLLKISLKEPRYDPFKTVAITANGHRVSSGHKGNFVVAAISLNNLRKGALTIEVRATTVLGHALKVKRTYHVCAKHKAHKGHKKG